MKELTILDEQLAYIRDITKKKQKNVITAWIIGFIMLVCGYTTLVILEDGFVAVIGGIIALVGTTIVWLSGSSVAMEETKFKYVNNTFWVLVGILAVVVLIVGRFIESC